MRRRAVLGGVAIGLALGGAGLIAAGAAIPAKAKLAQFLLARAWAETADGIDRARPWPWADTWPVARLRAPSAAIDQIVLAGGSGRTLAFGPGQVDGTAAPGAPGLTVIGGHRDTHFRFLADLAIGDEILIDRPDGTSVRYRVTALDIVHKDLARARAAGDRSWLLLSTCWPFDAIVPGGPMRYLVWAVAEDGIAQS